MKLFKSIKWRLQLWYGLVLVLVLAGFGFMAYQIEAARQMRRIDDELQRRLTLLANSLRAPDGLGQRRPPFDHVPPDGFPGDGPPLRNQRRLENFQAPPQAAGLFDAAEAHNFFFVIHLLEPFKVISRSDNAPQDFITEPRPNLRSTGKPRNQFRSRMDFTGDPPKPPEPQNQSGYRILANVVNENVLVEVGCSLAPEHEELHFTALKLAGFGGAVLCLGLIGGWGLVSRSLRPISAIGATATKISAGDLSQRINMAEAESELGQLASVLNSTFARLEAAFAQQKQFASDAAHELRTPVSVILTQTQTALNRERSAPEYRETVETCQRAAQRMKKLIGTLLELARFDAGQEILKRLKFDLSKTVADCADLVQPLAGERQVRIIAELAPLEITGDPERLTQVVTNLLTNAIQYNKPGGEVRVALASEGGLAILKIADTGRGIAGEDLPRVFERFYRAEKSRTGAGNAGLGLAIAKAIVEAHGGNIEAASDENIGTTFTVRLPVA